MTSLSSLAYNSIRCSATRKNNDADYLSTDEKINYDVVSRSVFSSKEKLFIRNNPENRRYIPRKKQLVDPFRQGLIFEDICYRQTVVIRSSEIEYPHETATIESILNLLQETALNHAWMTGNLSCGSGSGSGSTAGAGAGASPGMIRNNLTWVLLRMHVKVDCYPIWGEVIDIDTWVGASGRHGMRRDWLLKSHSTGHIYARATSKWVMMNQITRRLSKIPEDVMRDEVSPWFNEKQAFHEESPCKIEKLMNQNVQQIVSGLKPRWSDLDMNQHVNNVKYARWMLEAIPEDFLKNNQLLDITMEYKRECNISDVVQSLCHPRDDDEILEKEHQYSSSKCNLQVNGYSLPLSVVDGNGTGQLYNGAGTGAGAGAGAGAYSSFTHLLQTESLPRNEEIARGITRWKLARC